jgi:ssDNA thymidine ADP-ribosyltransferase, DarT
VSLADDIQQRKISEVLHFTTNRGLTGSLVSRSLLSRPLLNKDAYLRHVLKLNSAVRPEESTLFDKTEDWLRFVNLSISEINRRFLDVSRRWHTNADVWWCILSFDSAVMTHGDVWFATTNNAYPDCRRGQGQAGFAALFEPKVLRKQAGFNGPWYAVRGSRAAHLATCEQAEVLYSERLSLDHLRIVYVEQPEHCDAVVGWLSEFGYASVSVVIDRQKFLGSQN